MKKRITLTIALVFISIISIAQRGDTLDLPFVEDWSSGLLETNGWWVDTGWIVINETGFPEPCVFFNSSGFIDHHSGVLASPYFDASGMNVGEVWLEFDVKLHTTDALRWGDLCIQVWNPSGWHYKDCIQTIPGSFDWKHVKLNISGYSIGETFRFRFVASGNDLDINKWYIDNILVHRVCSAPSHFEIKSIDTLEYDKYRLNFAWQMDEPGQGEWLHWDDGLNVGGIGFACTGKFCAAARWDSAQLADYDNYRITRVKAFLSDSGYDSLQFNICTGEHGNNHEYTSDYLGTEADVWIEHQVDTALFLDKDLEYWIGYSLRLYNTSAFPFGYDIGPAITGYGDMMKACGSNQWDKMSELGFNYNWNIQFYVEDEAGNEILMRNQAEKTKHRNNTLLGYNLYESSYGEEYQLRNFIPWEYGDTTFSIGIYANPYANCYQLRAVWISETDTCESAPAISKDNPDEDFVCVLLVGEEELYTDDPDFVKCYPNPFSHAATFEYTLENAGMTEIFILNHLGNRIELIQERQRQGKQQVHWDAKDNPPGMYYFLLQSGKQRASGKMILIK